MPIPKAQVRCDSAKNMSSMQYAAGNLHAFSGLRDLGVFSTVSSSNEETILAVQAAVPRTLDLSANSFSGQFPDWLVDGLVSAPEHVNVNLTVCTAQLSVCKQYLCCA